MDLLLGKLIIVDVEVSSYLTSTACMHGCCRFYIGKKPQIMISDLDILKEIMVKQFDNFSDHSVSCLHLATSLYSTTACFLAAIPKLSVRRSRLNKLVHLSR